MKRFIINSISIIVQIIPESLIQAVYRNKPLAIIVRKLMNLSVPHNPEVVAITGGEVKDLRMELHLQGEKDHWLGAYELLLQKALVKWMKPGIVAYDIGANIGYITLLLARIAGANGQVFAFEALPVNVVRLQKNIDLNMCISAVNIVPKAVVDQDGEVKFLVHPSISMGKAAGSAGREEEYLEEIDVPAVSLDSFVFNQGNPPPDLIKLDIEGGEVLAFPGMRRVLDEHSPLLFIEIHGEEAARVTWETLKSTNYTLCSLDNDFQVINNLEDLDWKAYVMARKL